jgi:hypothetical protein
MSVALTTSPSGSTVAAKRRLQPLDVIFYAITLLIPIELIVQTAFGASMAFGRFIAPLFIVAYIALRPPSAAFRLPPGFLLAVPWFVTAFAHIAVQGDWYGVYNYRSYVLNAILCVAAYNYALSNRPSPRHVLLTTYVGITLMALWSFTSGQAAEVHRGRFTVLDMDENGLGSTYGLAVVIAPLLASRADVRLPMKAMLVAGALPCAALLLATGSRGALVSTVLAILVQSLYLAIFQRRGGLLIGGLVLATIVGVGKYFYDQTDIIRDRMAQVVAESSDEDRYGHRDILIFGALEILGESPFVGWGEKAGWNELGRRVMRGSRDHSGTHNTYLLVLITSGVFAGGAFLWWALRPMIPRPKLLAISDYGNLYVVMVFLYGTFLTLDRLGHRQWWWLFPIFLAQEGLARAASRRAVPAQRPYRPSFIQSRVA